MRRSPAPRRSVLSSTPAAIALLIGCASAPGAAPPQDSPGAADDLPELAAPTWDEFRPIRFGDSDEHTDEAPFFPGTTHDEALPRPSDVLGQPLGSRPAHPDEILAVFRSLADASPRVRLERYGRTFEGRELVRAIVTSGANHERLDAIRDALRSLADPRELTVAEEERLVRETPACAWLGYSIHGDEISGADASMAVAHHLAAGTSSDVTDLLDDLVVVIDPCMNPDGRERFVSMLEQTRGFVPNRDWASMQRGRWPEGRGNHYLFDMNRDWIAGVAPETRGRWRAVRDLPPQLFVDAHEMGGLDTYLFYPQAPAFNPHLPASTARWQETFGDDQAAAFDAEGWGFYTREWADAWGPFYSDAWGSLSGAIGILYEQASTDGQPVQRASGEVVPYRTSVRKQSVSSLANLETLRAHREEVLADFVAGKRANLEVEERWFVCRLGRNRAREDELLRILLGQGIEVLRAGDEQTAQGAVDTLGEVHDELQVPAGSLIVPARQPLAPLVLNYLGFDVRMGAEDLLREREELERKDASRLYDVTAWGLPLALDLDAFWCDGLLAMLGDIGGEPVTSVPARTGTVVAPPEADRRPTAWAVDGTDDAALVFAVRAMESGLRVHLSDEPFTTAGRGFPRWSLLVRRHENDAEGLEERVRAAAEHAGVEVVATAHGRSADDGPDLGGGHFALLERPRVAVLANAPVSRDGLGHLWYLLDHELGVPYSMLDATSFGYYDLRRYNVLVLPPAGGSLRAILSDNAERLRTWVRAGGTLVACGRSAAMLADEDLGLSAVRRRRDVLDRLGDFALAAERERAARAIEIDEHHVWNGLAPQTEDADAERDADVSEETDEWMRRFSPQGVFLRGEVNPLTWLTAGVETDELPTWVTGSTVLLAEPPVTTAVRLAPADRLRLSGLLWPEARERLADSAWATRERLGNGQVVLFAAQPGFRGYLKATGRLFANAVVYGPGAGADAPIGW